MTEKSEFSLKSAAKKAFIGVMPAMAGAFYFAGNIVMGDGNAWSLNLPSIGAGLFIANSIFLLGASKFPLLMKAGGLATMLGSSAFCLDAFTAENAVSGTMQFVSMIPGLMAGALMMTDAKAEQDGKTPNLIEQFPKLTAGGIQLLGRSFFVTSAVISGDETFLKAGLLWAVADTAIGLSDDLFRNWAGLPVKNEKLPVAQAGLKLD